MNAMEHPTKTFGLRSPRDLHRKLRHDIERLRGATSSDGVRYAVFDCAVTALHLVDWVWCALDKDRRTRLTGTAAGRDYARRFIDATTGRLPALEYCWQIATGMKHVRASKRDSAQMTTRTSLDFAHHLRPMPHGRDWRVRCLR